MRPVTAPRSHLVLTASSALTLTFAPGAPAAAENAFPPGQYEIVWQTVMPHLDEMRRISDRETRCLRGTPSELFPVLRQPALRGCDLGASGAGSYSLICASERVASGSATLSAEPATLRGTLTIKMGGKNMTFSQHVTATRRGGCSGRGEAPR